MRPVEPPGAISATEVAFEDRHQIAHRRIVAGREILKIMGGITIRQPHGHDLEDWLRAEAEIVGKKPASAAEAEDTEDGSRAAAA